MLESFAQPLPSKDGTGNHCVATNQTFKPPTEPGGTVNGNLPSLLGEDKNFIAFTLNLKTSKHAVHRFVTKKMYCVN